MKWELAARGLNPGTGLRDQPVKHLACVSPPWFEESRMTPDEIRNAAAELTGLFRQLLQSMTDASTIWPASGIDDGSSLVMPALAGVAAAMTVALMLAIYFQTGYRSYRDMIRHGLAAAVGLTVLAFVVYDMRDATIAHVAKTPVRPAVQFEMQWRTAAVRVKTLATEMDRAARPAPEAHQG